MTLLDLLDNEKLQIIRDLACKSGYTRLLLHNFSDSDDPKGYYPIRFMALPEKSFEEDDKLAFALKQNFSTMFSVESCNPEELGVQYNSESFAIDLLDQKIDHQKLEEVLSNIYGVKKEEFSTVSFSAINIMPRLALFRNYSCNTNEQLTAASDTNVGEPAEIAAQILAIPEVSSFFKIASISKQQEVFAALSAIHEQNRPIRP